MEIQETEGKRPWLCLHLFTLKPYEISDYFKENGFNTFIPEHWTDFEDSNGHIKHELRPVVKNFLFIESQGDIEKINDLVKTNLFKMTLMKYSPSATGPALIPSKEMEDFKIMCNPDLNMTLFISEEDAKLKQGDHVTVFNGPLKGLSGLLVRKCKKYYLLKEVPGMGVMLKVSRWCCKKDEI